MKAYIKELELQMQQNVFNQEAANEEQGQGGEEARDSSSRPPTG